MILTTQEASIINTAFNHALQNRIKLRVLVEKVRKAYIITAFLLFENEKKVLLRLSELAGTPAKKACLKCLQNIMYPCSKSSM